MDALGSDTGTVCIDHTSGATTTYTVTTPLTIPANVKLKVWDGARITKGGAGTMTINGPFEAGIHQVFASFTTGNIVFGASAVKEVYPEWWATNTAPGTTDMGTAWNCAINSVTTTGGTIKPGSTSYLIDTVIVWKSNVSVEVPSNGKVLLKQGATATQLITGTSISGFVISGLTLQGDSGTSGAVTTTDNGIYLNGCSNFKVSNNEIK